MSIGMYIEESNDGMTRDKLAMMAGCRDGDDHQYVRDVANLMMDKTKCPGGFVMSVRHPVDGRIGCLIWAGAAYAVWDGQTLRSVDQQWAERIVCEGLGHARPLPPVEHNILPPTPGFVSDLL